MLTKPKHICLSFLSYAYWSGIKLTNIYWSTWLQFNCLIKILQTFMSSFLRWLRQFFHGFNHYEYILYSLYSYILTIIMYIPREIWLPRNQNEWAEDMKITTYIVFQYILQPVLRLSHISIDSYFWKRKDNTVLSCLDTLAHLSSISRPWNENFHWKKTSEESVEVWGTVTQLITLDIKSSKYNDYFHFCARRVGMLLENEFIKVLLISLLTQQEQLKCTYK